MNGIYEAIAPSLPGSPWASPSVKAAPARPMVAGDVRGLITKVPPFFFLPSFITCDTGQSLVSAYLYDTTIFTLPDGTEIDTIAIDFLVRAPIDQSFIRSVMDSVALPRFDAGGDKLLGYALCVGEQVLFTAPDEWCLDPLNSLTCIPTFIGGLTVSTWHHRLWMFSVAKSTLGLPLVSPSVRPLVGEIIALTVAAILGALLIVGIIAWREGKITWQELRQTTLDILKTPGENVAAPIGAFTWPLVAFGIALVAAGIFIPMASAGIEAQVPIGGARVGVTGRAGGAPRRRR